MIHHDASIKQFAKNLRREGKTFGEIQQCLKMRIPKSTLSEWCKGIALPAEYAGRLLKINYLNLRKGRERARQKAAEKKLQITTHYQKRSRSLITKVNKDIAKLLLAVLYLGEGTKRYGSLMLGSADVGIIQLFLKLLAQCYGITKDMIRCRISYRVDQDIDALQQYWMHVLQLPKKQFYKTIPDPRTTGHITKKLNYKGVCVVYVVKSTNIHKELEVIADLLKNTLE